MSLREIFAVVVAVAILVGLPVVLIYAAVDYVRHSTSRRSTGGSSSGVGAALQELDRVTRPSAEHVVEAQQPVVRQDDQSGE
jgi:hypothetical protein